MTKRVLLICNPKASRGKARKMIATLQSDFAKVDHIVWEATQYHGHAIELASQAADLDFERVIACGGDGTTHEVINGLMHIPANQRPKLGIIPTGSGNDFSVSLGIPQNPHDALQTALATHTRTIDAALLTDDTGRREYFINTLGIGFDALANINAQRGPHLPGIPIYLTAALRTILYHHRPIHVRAESDEGVWEEEIVLFIACNGRQEGRMFRVAPHAKQDDGRIDFVGVRTISRPKMLFTLPYMIRGDHKRLNYCFHGSFETLKLTSKQPLIMHADGEIISGFDSQIHSIKIKAVPGALEIAVPASSGQDKVREYA